MGPSSLSPTAFVGPHHTGFRAVLRHAIRLCAIWIAAGIVAPVAARTIEAVRQTLIQHPFIAVTIVSALLAVVLMTVGFVGVVAAVVVSEVAGKTSATHALRDWPEAIIVVPAHAALVVHAPPRQATTPLMGVSMAPTADLVVADRRIAPAISAAPALDAFIVHTVGRIPAAPGMGGRITNGEQSAIEGLPPQRHRPRPRPFADTRCRP